MRKKHWLVAGILFACFLSVILGLTLAGKEASTSLKKERGEKIALVYLEGQITGGRGGGPNILGQAGGTDPLLDQLREIARDKEVKGVLFRINSPGGSSAASQEVYEEITKVRKSGKVVVVSMGDVAASGGYWIACAADKIVANPATMTGSIGVIMPLQNIQELLDKIGVQPETIKSGKYKDMGSSNRPLAPEERQLLQAMVDDIYQQFVDVVVAGRKMPREEVLAVADGRVFTGKQAKELGLVDELGNYYDALDLLTKLANIQGEPVIKEYGRRNPFSFLLGESKSINQLINQIQPTVPELR